MPSLDQLAAQPQTHRLIIYGSPGSGKTWSLGRLADTHKLHYFSLENGYRTFLNPECVSIESRKNIQIIQMQDTPETPIVFTSLDKFLKEKRGNFCEDHGRIDCPICQRAKKDFISIDIEKLTPSDILIFDSLTQWAESISFYLSKDSDSKGDFEYYRKLGLYLGRALSRIQLISNCSIIVISHETGTETVTGSERITPAGGTRNFARNNARYFDGAYYAYKENRKHKLASSSLFSTTIDTKDRLSFDTSKFKDSRNALFALFNPELTDKILAEENPKETLKGKK